MSKVDLKELRTKVKTKFKEAKDFADSHGMGEDATEDPSEADLASVQEILKEANALDQEYAKQSKIQGIPTEIKERYEYYSQAVMGRSLGLRPVFTGMSETPVSLGRQFVTSEGYKTLISSKVLDMQKSRVQMDPQTFATTDLIDPGTGAAQDGLVLPHFLPGVLGLPQRPLTVRDLFADATTQSDVIDYAAQVSFESGAAPVATATSVTPGGTGLKPQSSFAWERRQSPVETLATLMATTRRALADAGQISSLIDNQGRLMLQLVEEDQIIDGSGATPELRGLLHTDGVQTLDLSGLAGTASEVEGKQLDGIRVARRLVQTGLSRLRADSIILHPEDSEAFDLMKDGNGQYRGGNPVGNFTFDQPLWGLRRVESEAIPAGTGIAGAFKAGGTVYERQGITVYTSDSHLDFFAKNLIAILFEERLGFTVFYPSAFVVINFDDLFSGSGAVDVQSGA